jgi:Gluconate 2-dehydrogenase subunit 3
MQRRTAIKNIALTIGGAIALPSWANAWSRAAISSPSSLSFAEENLLAEIVETIIPKTDTPGAKEMGIHTFVAKMIKDCYDKKAQAVFTKGLELVENTAKNTHSKSFVSCDAIQKLALLNQFSKSENEAEKAFLQLVKSLAIRGYLSSEYVMTNLRKYELIPARYHGCVPI